MPNTIRMPKPRTEAQRAAARANGAKSKGPTTEEGKAKSALNALRHGLLAGSLVLTSESRTKFDALLNAYLDEYRPQGQTENDLVEEITAAKWQQQRCWALTTALLDVTMDHMSEEISNEFANLDTPTRTALAFLKQASQSAALVLLNRYAARHGREWHRAIDKLRAIQKERREQSDPPSSPLAPHHSPLEKSPLEKSPNEPEPATSPEPSTISPLATRHSSLEKSPLKPATEFSPLEPSSVCYPEMSST